MLRPCKLLPLAWVLCSMLVACLAQAEEAAAEEPSFGSPDLAEHSVEAPAHEPSFESTHLAEHSVEGEAPESTPQNEEDLMNMVRQAAKDFGSAGEASGDQGEIEPGSLEENGNSEMPPLGETADTGLGGANGYEEDEHAISEEEPREPEEPTEHEEEAGALGAEDAAIEGEPSMPEFELPPYEGQPEDDALLMDSNADCAMWASEGECTLNSKYMLKNCPASCRGLVAPNEVPADDEATCSMEDLQAGTCTGAAAPSPAENRKSAGLTTPEDHPEPTANEEASPRVANDEVVEEQAALLREVREQLEEAKLEVAQLKQKEKELNSVLKRQRQDSQRQEQAAVQKAQKAETAKAQMSREMEAMRQQQETAEQQRQQDLDAARREAKREAANEVRATVENAEARVKEAEEAAEAAKAKVSADASAGGRDSVIAIYSVFRTIGAWAFTVVFAAGQRATSHLGSLEPPLNIIVGFFSVFVLFLVSVRGCGKRAPATVVVSAPAVSAPAVSAPAVTDISASILPLQHQIDELKRQQQHEAAKAQATAAEATANIVKLAVELKAFQTERGAMDEEMLLSTKEILEWLANGSTPHAHDCVLERPVNQAAPTNGFTTTSVPSASTPSAPLPASPEAAAPPRTDEQAPPTPTLAAEPAVMEVPAPTEATSAAPDVASPPAREANHAALPTGSPEVSSPTPEIQPAATVAPPTNLLRSDTLPPQVSAPTPETLPSATTPPPANANLTETIQEIPPASMPPPMCAGVPPAAASPPMASAAALEQTPSFSAPGVSPPSNDVSSGATPPPASMPPQMEEVVPPAVTSPPTVAPSSPSAPPVLSGSAAPGPPSTPMGGPAGPPSNPPAERPEELSASGTPSFGQQASPPAASTPTGVPGGPPAGPPMASPPAASTPAGVSGGPPGGPPMGPSGGPPGALPTRPQPAGHPPIGASRPVQQEIKAAGNPFGVGAMRPQQQPIKAASNPFGARPIPKEIAASSNPFGPR